MARVGRLGTVAVIAWQWGLGERLSAAERYGAAYEACLACRVESSRRSRLSAGQAWVADRRIVLNAALLEPGRESDRDSTFLHECAHVIADLHHGRQCHHGRLWAAVMMTLGELPTARHRIDYLSRRAHARVIWTCVDCGEEYHYIRRPRRRISDCRCARCGPEGGRLVATRPGSGKGEESA